MWNPLPPPTCYFNWSRGVGGRICRPEKRCTYSWSKRILDCVGVHPLADCEALSQQKKKKAANKLNVRPFTREVVLLHQYRGEQFLGIKYTKRCNVKSISSHWSSGVNMSSLEVKNVICRGFQHISGFSSLHYFECIQNNCFAVMASRDLGGESVSAKKGGSLCLCEVCEDVCSLRYSHTHN